MRSELDAFQKEMPMLPTYLYSSGKLQKGGKAVVIDAGGTNFRTAVVGFDGILLTTYTEPKLTTVDQQIEQKGYEGMRLLSRILERPEEARCLYLPHVLKERQSTGQKNEGGG